MFAPKAHVPLLIHAIIALKHGWPEAPPRSRAEDYSPRCSSTAADTFEEHWWLHRGCNWLICDIKVDVGDVPRAAQLHNKSIEYRTASPRNYSYLPSTHHFHKLDEPLLAKIDTCGDECGYRQ